MIIAPLRSTALSGANRLDARYHTAPAVRIRRALSAVKKTPLLAIGEYAQVRMPGRLKQARAAPGEGYVSYLRPYDVFEYLPPEAHRLSATRTENLADYMITSGELLQTRSGRNLGPLTIADNYLAQFALSDDMLRITISDETQRYYTLAFLQSPVGQRLLRGDLNGSVIDHLSEDQVAAIQVPFIAAIAEVTAALMRYVTKTREQARITLHSAVAAVNAVFDISTAAPLRDGWTVKAAALGSRLDAAYHSERVQSTRERLRAAGGVQLGEVAQVTKPDGRVKLYYVQPEHGNPLLSGRQLLQSDVIGPKYVSPRSIPKNEGYELRSGWTAFPADGRAEEGLGHPAMVTPERDGWLAYGLIGRAIPKAARDAGWLWAAIASDAVQEQIAALASGSVVDHLYMADLESVMLPPRALVDSATVTAAWRGFSDAAVKAAKALKIITDGLAKLGIAI